MTMLVLILLAGMALLYVGAELLVRSSVKLSQHFRVPRLVIGLTIVAFTTSAPEALTSILAQLKGASGDVALGNVLGSNIANIGLVLGLYLLIRPCDVTKDLKWQKMPVLLFVYLLVFLVMLGGTVIKLEGIFLLLVLALYTFLQYYIPPKKAEIEEEINIHVVKRRSKRVPLYIFYCAFSAFLLVVGTNFLIDGSLGLAARFSLPERVVSISIIAIGTSLPEIATALIAAFRKETEILVGTVIGSNIFNPLLTIPCAALIRPIRFSKNLLLVDFPVMVAFTLLLWALMFFGKSRLSRLDGSILLTAYLAYIVFLFI